MSEAFPRTRRLIEEGIANRLHLGAQVYVSVRGNVLADFAVGESRAGVAMSTQTVNPWMSSGKPATALAIAQLWENGKLDLDDRVTKYIPEFSARGKEAITIRHLLTHMGGFRAVIGLLWNDPFEKAIDKICRAGIEPRWVLGKSAGYHASSSWYVLGEIVRRIDGRPIDRYLREMIFLPLNMPDCWLGIPPSEYRGYGDRIGVIHVTDKGQMTPADPLSSEQDAAAVRPGANVRGPIRQLGLFYEMLLKRDVPEVVGPQTIEALTARHRAGVTDQTFKQIVDFGLGFLINSSQYGQELLPYGYGPHASLRTFGHSGQLSSSAFCDPESGLVAAWICNGMPEESTSHRRQHAINGAIYEDAGLVSAPD